MTAAATTPRPAFHLYEVTAWCPATGAMLEYHGHIQQADVEDVAIEVRTRLGLREVEVGTHPVWR